MIQELATDYASYFKLDVSGGFQTVEAAVDNMLTRLEELTTVLEMIKLKNDDCCTASSKDISKYRMEITSLSKKVNSVAALILLLQNNVTWIEKRVEKAEVDFGINNENVIKNLLWSFLKLKKEHNSASTSAEVILPERLDSVVVSNYFQNHTNSMD